MSKIVMIEMNSKTHVHGKGHGCGTRSRGSDGNSKSYHSGQAHKGMVKATKGGC